MNITPDFLDEIRDRTRISEVVGRYVSWDQKKTQTAKGDYWAPCPFHHEKTASFHVSDPKGFYYCFGCHEKGDVIGFTMKLGNMSFVEAVRQLAESAGLALPKQSKEAAARQSERDILIDIHEQAARYYQRQLKSAAGEAARDYLKSREMKGETALRFGLGYAGHGSGLATYLQEQGVAPNLMERSGLVIFPEDGRAPFDRFRDRIIFPIHDARSRVIAFGGRAMAKDAQAKYLNSPETPIFHKGRVLYNYVKAREAIGKGAPLIVTEGYMDVIALDAAGFHGAIAPLGTAITEEQLQLIWRLHEEPVIALDGDTAGLRAAYRLSDLALPMISPKQRLRFAIMPSGLDPDDVIKSKGREAMAGLIESAMPFVELLWRREFEAAPLDTPEGKADFDERIRGILEKIKTPALRNHYRDAFREKRAALFKSEAPRARQNTQTRPYPQSGFRKGGVNTVQPSSLQSAMVKSANYPARLREATVLRALLVYPDLLRQFSGELANLTSDDKALEDLRFQMLAAHEKGDVFTLSEHDLARIFAPYKLANSFRYIRDTSREADAKRAVQEALSKIRAEIGLREEREDAYDEIRHEQIDEALTARLHEASKQHDEVYKQRDDAEQVDSREDYQMLEELRKKAELLKKK